MADTAAASPVYAEIPDRRHRFVTLVGEGFLIGAALGSAVHSIKGFRNSPAGGRLAGAAHAAMANAPGRLAGIVGAYSGLFCVIEGAMAAARRRDDPWNSIAAGAAAWGLLHVPLGGRTAAVSALFGAAVGVVAEGVVWVDGEWDRRFAPNPSTRTRPPGLLAPAITTAMRTESPLSWLRTSSASVSSPSITSKKDLEVLDMSRKFLLEKMNQGFYSPSVVYGFSSLRGGNHI